MPGGIIYKRRLGGRLRVGRRVLAPLVRVRILPPQPLLLLGPHRLAVQDTALSRRRHGFDSRWGYQILKTIKVPAKEVLGKASFLCFRKKNGGGRGSSGCTAGRNGQGVD